MITPVVLCGGRGERLWPLSRKSFPKQFSSLDNDRTLLQTTMSGSAIPCCTAPIVMTANDYRFIVAEQLRNSEVGTIILEPTPMGTGPSVLVAALHALADDADAVLLVIDSTPVLPSNEILTAALDLAEEAARSGAQVGFNDAEGLLITRADAVIANANEGELAKVRAALDEANTELDFLRLNAELWVDVAPSNFDMTPTQTINLGTHCVDTNSWEVVWQSGIRDSNGVVSQGNVQAIDCTDSLLRSESSDLELVGLGLKNIVVVATPDAVLVADKSCANDVPQAVAALNAKGAKQAIAFPKDHRPWGWFESLVIGGRYQVKRICVHPGASLSLQSHHHRAEHWIVVEGTANVTVGDKIHLLSENQSAHIPLGAIHRMENPGKVPMVLIEVQIGSYVGEDDIIRYEDVYARS